MSHLLKQTSASTTNPDQYIQPIHYRPFDKRWTYYTGKSSGFHARPRNDVMRHLLSVDNPSLCVCRVVKSPMWQHVLVTDQITDKSYISNRTSESTYTFPLYLYPISRGVGTFDRTFTQFQTSVSHRVFGDVSTSTG